MPTWLIILIIFLLVVPALIGIIILIIEHHNKQPHPDEWWFEQLTAKNIITLKPNGKGKYIIHIEIYMESWNRVGLDNKTAPTCRVYKTYTNTPIMCLRYLFRDTKNWFGFSYDKDDNHDSMAFKYSLVKFLEENLDVDPLYKEVLDCFKTKNVRISDQFNNAYRLINRYK